MERSSQSAASTPPARRASMLWIIIDLPNAVTLVGAGFTMAALALLVSGSTDAALSCVLWSHLADSLDGLLASRMKARPCSMHQVGKSMDMLADFLSAGVFPLVLLMAVADVSPLSIVSGMAICTAGILRLSYFDALGLDQGRFVGLPLPHNILVLPVVYLVVRDWHPEQLANSFAVAAIFLSALHVSPLRVPKFSQKAIAASAIYIAVLNLLLLT